MSYSVTHLVRRVLKSGLIRASGFMFIASLVSGILGYLFQIIIAKYLSVTEFGLASAYISLLSIFVVPLGAYSMILTRMFAFHYGKDDIGSVREIYKDSSKKVVFLSSIFFCIIFPFCEQLTEFFNSDKLNSTYAFLLLVCATMLTAPNASFFQGLQKFNWVAINGVFGQIGKLLIGFFLILLGLGAEGVLLGIAITTLIMLLVNSIAIRRYFGGMNIRQNRELQTGENLKTIFPVLVANLAFVVLSQLDVVLVKSNFTPALAGAYALAAVFGKAIMYLPGAIVVALYPMVAANDAKNRSSLGLLLQSVCVTGLISGAGAIFYYFASPAILLYLYGEKYSASINVLQYYGLAMVPMAIVMVLEYFLMAKKRVLFAYLMILVVPLEAYLINRFNSDLIYVVWVQAFCGWLLVIVGLTVLIMQNKRLFVENGRKCLKKIM